jgi:ketosteroid isomerase-like protein
MQSSQSTRNTELIQRIYAAFGKGDVATVLDGFAADGVVSFEGASPEVPWHATVQGTAQIPRFFAALAAAVEFEIFDPHGWVANDDTVAVQLHLRYRVKKTGKLIDQQQVHWWSIRDGKATRVHHFDDTQQVVAACRA